MIQNFCSGVYLFLVLVKIFVFEVIAKWHLLIYVACEFVAVYYVGYSIFRLNALQFPLVAVLFIMKQNLAKHYGCATRTVRRDDGRNIKRNVGGRVRHRVLLATRRKASKVVLLIGRKRAPV